MSEPDSDPSAESPSRLRFSPRMLLPGILIAATGVGAGDLLTAGFAGSKLGLAILWAALVGALLKWFLNEGLARWQMATGTTLLEGWITKLGAWINWVFLIYLLLWSFFVGGALVSACGVAGAGLIPLFDNPADSKIVWGIVHSLLGLTLAWAGGYRVFEVIMSTVIAIMFVTVIATAALSEPDFGAIAQGLVWPSMPYDEAAGLTFSQSARWTLGVIGGVGGTLTLLSYGYWIREEKRAGTAGLRICRIDLTVGYTLTALFGIAMIVICSKVELSDKGAAIVPILAGQLAETLGPFGYWAFLIGFWGAVFSSLLGVWQSVPYLFADFMLLRQGESAAAARRADLSKTPAYRGYLVALALLPLATLWVKLEQIQLAYAVMGAFFMPLLALTLLLMNNRKAWVGQEFRNNWVVNAGLVLTIAFFCFMGAQQILNILAPFFNDGMHTGGG